MCGGCCCRPVACGWCAVVVVALAALVWGASWCLGLTWQTSLCLGGWLVLGVGAWAGAGVPLRVLAGGGWRCFSSLRHVRGGAAGRACLWVSGGRSGLGWGSGWPCAACSGSAGRACRIVEGRWLRSWVWVSPSPGVVMVGVAGRRHSWLGAEWAGWRCAVVVHQSRRGILVCFISVVASAWCPFGCLGALVVGVCGLLVTYGVCSGVLPVGLQRFAGAVWCGLSCWSRPCWWCCWVALGWFSLLSPLGVWW